MECITLFACLETFSKDPRVSVFGSGKPRPPNANLKIKVNLNKNGTEADVGIFRFKRENGTPIINECYLSFTSVPKKSMYVFEPTPGETKTYASLHNMVFYEWPYKYGEKKFVPILLLREIERVVLARGGLKLLFDV